MKHLLKKFVSLLLAFAMMLALSAPAIAADGTPSGMKGVKWEKIETDPELTARLLKEVVSPSAPQHAPTDNVRVSIVLDERPVMEAGFSTAGIADNAMAMDYRDSLRRTQDSVASAISKKALNGARLDVVWNLTLAANVLSANIPYESIDRVKSIPGVKDVILEARYAPAVTRREPNGPNMSVASGMVGGDYAWQSEYTGAGSLVAIIDTGLDVEHELFSEEAFLHALEESGKNVSLLDPSAVRRVWDDLNASAFLEAPDQPYFNAKIPYAVNYVDKSTDVTHANDTQGEHGSHVAGIAAANRFVMRDGEAIAALDAVKTQGEAPDAQVMVMKVFGASGGAYDSDYMAAIEDAIMLGADAVNLSLGSDSAGFVTHDAYQEILDNLVKSDTVVTISAGNSYHWPFFTDGPSIYSDGVNFNTVGSPGSFANSLTVASVDNDGMSGMYFEVGDEKVLYGEPLDYGNAPLSTASGVHSYVYLDGPGVDDNDHLGQEGDDFLALGRDILEGRIAVCNRGETSFFIKANAAAAQGASAVIIVNNEPGSFNMNLTGYEYDIPVVCITQEDGELLKQTFVDGDIPYYTGELTVSDRAHVDIYGEKYYTMSGFSSWGVPGDLSLKPEITAPGGNIYSLNGYHISGDTSLPAGGHDQYESMSGTSMAAPQVAGLAALVAQYMREQGVRSEFATRRALINSLLMSTSVPLKDTERHNYYPVINQGAGLISVNAAINADTYIMMDENATVSAADGKVKVELGDDPDRLWTSDGFGFDFTIFNFTDKALEYDLSAEFFTQDLFTEDDAEYMDVLTVPLLAQVTFLDEKGEEFPTGSVSLDFNGDSTFDDNDAKTILEVLANGSASGIDENVLMERGADLNEDGRLDTYDAYLALTLVSKAAATVPASGSLKVRAEVVLDANSIEKYDVSGAYVEGYVFAEGRPDSEGVAGTAHSIPVLGYYGSWSEPTMHDVGSIFEYTDEVNGETRKPYMFAALDLVSYQTETFMFKREGDNRNYVLGGNPAEEDRDEYGNIVYLPERNAISPNSFISGAQYSLIRNSAGGLFRLTVNGKTEKEVEIGKQAAAYFSQSQDAWGYSTSTADFSYSPRELKDGDRLELTYAMAPEYYLYDEGDERKIRWDDIYADSAMSINLMVDAFAPEIENVRVGMNDKQGVEGIAFDVKENHWISGIFVYTEDSWNDPSGFASLAIPSDIYEEEGAGRSVFIPSGDGEGELDLSSEYNQHLLIVVTDYAYNSAAYRLNLNDSELEGGVSELAISPAQIRLLPGSTARFSAEAKPWGTSNEVTWSVEDDDIASIDDSGLLTALSEGETRVIAVSKENPAVTASAELSVYYPDIDLNAVIYNSDERAEFAVFNTKDLLEGKRVYTSLGDVMCGSVNVQVADMAWDMDGNTVYVSDMEGNLYTMEPTTREVTLIGHSGDAELLYAGLIPSLVFPSLTENENATLMTCYGSYLVGIDVSTGEFVDGVDLSPYFEGTNMLAAAHLGSFHEVDAETEMEAYADLFYMVDDKSNLYLVEVWNLGGMLVNATLLGNFGAPTNAEQFFFNSLYYDGSRLYWARYSEGDSVASIYMADELSSFEIWKDSGEASVGQMYKLGAFAEEVWPVVGLIELNGQGQGAATSSASDSKLLSAERIEQLSALPALEFADSFEPHRAVSAPSGSTNSVTLSFRESSRPSSAENDEALDLSHATVTVKADQFSNNGFYTVEYDADVLTLKSVFCPVEYHVVNDSAPGSILLAYATRERLAKDEVVLVLEFEQKNEPVETEVVITNTELNDNEAPEDNEDIVLLGHAHQWSAPEWIWTEGESGWDATLTFICEKNPTHVESPAVTLEIDYNSGSDATCLEDGEITYTATAEFDLNGDGEINPDNEIFTDVQTFVLEAFGHFWSDPEYIWADDHSSLTVRFVCDNDAEHIREEIYEGEIDRVSTPPEGGKPGKTVYTATVEIDVNGDGEIDSESEIFTASDEVVNTFGEPRWTWAGTDGAYTAATATFTANEDAEVMFDKAAVITTETLTYCDKDGKKTFTASVQFDADGDGSEESFTDTKETVLPAVGHDWSEPEYIWADDHSSLTVRFVCLRDSSHIREAVSENGVSRVSTPPEADKPGKTVYTAAVEMDLDGDGKIDPNTEIFTASDEVENTFGAPRWIWTGTDGAYTDAAAVFTANEDANVSFEVKGRLTTHTAKPTTVLDGWLVHTASADFGGRTYTDVRRSIIPRLSSGGGGRPFSPVTDPKPGANAPQPADEPFPFSDVPRIPGRWDYEAIKVIYKLGLIKGKTDTLFAPNDKLTRAEVVTILWRLEKQPVVNYAMPFTDVEHEEWYGESVRWAASCGVVKGYVNGAGKWVFAPHANITREQLAAILYRYAQLKGQGFSGAWMFRLDFADADKLSEYAYEPMCWCVMREIINGVARGDGSALLDPQGYATRAQAAAMVSRMIETTK